MQLTKSKTNRQVIISALLFSVTYLICLYLLKRQFTTPPSSYLLVALPVLTFAIFIFYYIKDIGKMDEVQVRIHMEAVVIGFALGAILLMTLALLNYVILIDINDWGYGQIMHLSWLLYFAGLVITKIKYR